MYLHRGHTELRVYMRVMRWQGVHDPSHHHHEDKEASVTFLER
jgi:hypothetical protein